MSEETREIPLRCALFQDLTALEFNDAAYLVRGGPGGEERVHLRWSDRQARGFMLDCVGMLTTFMDRQALEMMAVEEAVSIAQQLAENAGRGWREASEESAAILQRIEGMALEEGILWTGLLIKPGWPLHRPKVSPREALLRVRDIALQKVVTNLLKPVLITGENPFRFYHVKRVADACADAFAWQACLDFDENETWRANATWRVEEGARRAMIQRQARCLLWWTLADVDAP